MSPRPKDCHGSGSSCISTHPQIKGPCGKIRPVLHPQVQRLNQGSLLEGMSREAFCIKHQIPL